MKPLSKDCRGCVYFRNCKKLHITKREDFDKVKPKDIFGYTPAFYCQLSGNIEKKTHSRLWQVTHVDLVRGILHYKSVWTQRPLPAFTPFRELYGLITVEYEPRVVRTDRIIPSRSRY